MATGEVPKPMTVDDLAKKYGEDWYVNHQVRTGRFVATLKHSAGDVRMSALTAAELAEQIDERMRIWSELRA